MPGYSRQRLIALAEIADGGFADDMLRVPIHAPHSLAGFLAAPFLSVPRSLLAGAALLARRSPVRRSRTRSRWCSARTRP